MRNIILMIFFQKKHNFFVHYSKINYSQLELQTNFDEQSKDEISQFAQKVIQDYSLQKRVLITVNVAEATVGLVGNNEVTKTAVYNMLLQLATFHSYLD